MAPKHWLMKAEPNSRIEKGKDVKFSVDDFEAVKTTPWEGVRNAEARNLMKEMRVGDRVLFYHSNCKSPGIAAFAEVAKEAYPDYTAWDSAHPYYDPKTDKENPKWFMVDVTFKDRAANFVPLALLRQIAASTKSPSEVAYIGADGVRAIKEMALVTRGRLSVQRVEPDAWYAIKSMAEKGGWEDNAASASKPTPKLKQTKSKKGGKNRGNEGDAVDEGNGPIPKEHDDRLPPLPARKRRAQSDEEEMAPRRSTRIRK
ncbi:DUF55-domain-containing protein [Obba rivulosa]|uniref:DUF55-domain-containing protein n=1 Tax=Obba rivulosa TaxID=1052685 RepID=A0A8E2DRH6_9APHY|nr:DUF55-domain-containing protein [Obba rivulosa]